jgi:hypothetical protein
MVLGMLGGEGVDVEAVDVAAAEAVVVVLTAEGTGVRVVGTAVAVVPSVLDAAPILLSVAVA